MLQVVLFVFTRTIIEVFVIVFELPSKSLSLFNTEQTFSPLIITIYIVPNGVAWITTPAAAGKPD